MPRIDLKKFWAFEKCMLAFFVKKIIKSWAKIFKQDSQHPGRFTTPPKMYKMIVLVTSTYLVGLTWLLFKAILLPIHEVFSSNLRQIHCQ